MYSVLLTAMMTTGATTPDFGGFSSGRNGCSGCFGCSGCCGGCSGCYGSGCCGGCSGCCGGCCGGGFLGWGLFTSRSSSCFGCSGCCGGCFGCHGNCYGGCMGCFGYSSGYSSMPINFGLPGPSPMVVPGMGEMVMPGIPADTAAPPTSPPNETLPPAAGLGESVTTPNRATVLVKLPADAKLFVDNELVNQTGTVRTFRTPDLEIGKSYYYVLSVEMERNGKPFKDEKRVALEPGKVTNVTFPEPPPGAGNTASIDIRLPEGAKLSVEGQAWTVQDGRAQVRTPELKAGRDHVYVLMVEVTRKGQRHTMSREVRFQAGQQVTVEFEEPMQARMAKR